MNIQETNDFELLELLLEEEGIEIEKDEFLIPRHNLTQAPASFQQRRLWFLHELEPTSSAYNICSVFRLDGELQVKALKQAFQELQKRHESLRTTFTAVDGEPWQYIHPNALTQISLEDWSQLSETELEKQIAEVGHEEAAYAFDLENGPLIRMRLLHLTATQHILTLTLHHIIADGWSIGVFLEELAYLYQLILQKDITSLAELKIQYADYAVWQQEKFTDRALEADLNYWETQLAELPTIQFPLDFTRPRLQSFRGDLVNFSIPPKLTQAIRALSTDADATLFMTLMAAFATLLGRYSGQEDIPIGTSIANRRGSDAEKLIGFFVNMLVIRADLSQEPSFRDIVSQVKDTVLEGFEHSQVPFESLVDRLQIERNTSINPLFQIAFTLLNAPKPSFGQGDLQVSTLVSQEAARFDLELFITEQEDSLSGVFSYNTDLLKRETVEQLAHHFCNLLENLVAQPDAAVSKLQFLSDEEYAHLMPSKPRQSFGVELCLHDIFSQQAALRPHKTALIYGEESLTYQELDQRANQLAHYLINLGVKVESKVGLWLSRSLDTVVSILAVLKAGATYVPFDPEYPRERVAYMLDDSQVEILITQTEFEQQLPPHRANLVFIDKCSAELSEQKSTNPVVDVTPDNAAYIIYTSGSTGKPKGVVVNHSNVVRLMLATEQWYHFNEKDVWTLFHSYAFDFSVWEMWGALFFGGRLVIVPYLVSRSPEDFYNLLCAARVTVLNQTPSAFRQLIQAEEVICRESELNLRYVIFGGEALDLSSLEPWFERHGDDFPLLVNMYGITETTVHVTYRPIRLRDVKKGLGSVIGEPIPDLNLYIFDKHLQPVPVGVIGEMYVGGAGVACGYLNRPELTAQRMIVHPDNKQRIYKTGDLARYLPNGEVEYLGRNDHQVKIRGFRIELGEIEAVLQRQPEVRQAHVMTWESSQEDVRLVAYIVPQLDQDLHGYQELLKEQTSEWQYTFDETYSGSQTQTSLDFNIAGWNNSYDGKPIPPEEMRQWLDNTLERINALAPQRVLEIGCGTGMILFNIAPQVESYWATDFSEAAIKRLESISDAKLLHREAIDFSEIPESYFDTIIINSVAQYFPDLEYFQQVIAGALNALVPGGSLFIGDNRNLTLLDAFHASVALFQSDEETDKETFSALMEQIADKENELVLNPSFFVNLTEIFDDLETVEIHLKAETSDNELTKYRYDVILHKKGGENGEYIEPVWVNWRSGMQLEDLRQSLSRKLEIPMGYCGIANARLIQDEAVLQWLQDETPSTTREILPVNVQSAINPSELYALARETGCQAIISYSPDRGTNYFDVCFYPIGGKAKQRPIMPIVKQKTDPKVTQSYSINPLEGRFSKTLIPQIKQQVREHLPEYMCPSAFVLLDKLPMTPSGKLDRRALPAPTQEAVIAKEAFVQANTSTEKRLCSIWSDVLGIEKIGLTNDFFSLGGHSLLATKLVSRIREEFNITLPLRTIFEYPTVVAQAEQIDSLNPDQENTLTDSDTIEPACHRENLPLSFAQQRLWFLDQLEPHNPAYNIVVGFRMDGHLNQATLHKSLQDIVSRHEILRTNFSQDNYGNPVQVIHQSNQIQFVATDLTHIPESEREKQLQDIVQQKALEPFNLETDSLLRVYIYKLKENTHVFVAVMHHIISDAWSFGIMVKELSQSYTALCQGNKASLPPLSLQYADFAHWQCTTFAQTQLQQQLDYWKQELAGDIQPLELPTDYPRGAITSYQGKEISFTVESQHYQAFKQLCESQGATLFMGLLAVFKILLMRYSGQQDILVGTPIANRNHHQTEDLIGFFVNSLVIRTNCDNNSSFTNLLDQIKEKTIKAYTHQDIPFEKVVEELQPERNLSYNPLFQVMFVLQNAPIGNLELPDLSLTPLEMETARVKFDLNLSMSETEAGLQGRWEYSTDLFDAVTIERMMGHFKTLLGGIILDPQQKVGELPLLTETEKYQLLFEWNATQVDYPQDKSIHQLFEEQVEKTPEAIAVVFAEQKLSYRELNTRANQLAHYLQNLGVKEEALVGLCVERTTPEMLVGMLAILKAGGAYVPLDPSYPPERLNLMLLDARVEVLLAQHKWVTKLPSTEAQLVCVDTDWEVISEQSTQNPVNRVKSDNLAYIIYTSGSTGKPKGVAVPHRAIARLLFNTNYIQIDSTDNIAQISNISFDAATFEIWGALLHGAKLVVIDQDTVLSPPNFANCIREQEISISFLTTALFERLASLVPQAFQSLKYLLFGGETVHVQKVREVLKNNPPQQLLHVYGPTESTTFSSWYLVEAVPPNATNLPIGQPISNTQIYILDGQLQPVPIGVPGELHIGGDGLAQGYFKRRELTAEKFIVNPFFEATTGEQEASIIPKLYKTGDLARYLPDGNIEYLGRIDHQVKIRGYRVELGEIETALNQHPQVQETLVTIRKDEPDNKQLVAYIVSHENTLDSIKLRQFLKDRLPEYMVPGAFVILDNLPLTPNGKVNRKALPAPSSNNSVHSKKYILPRTAVEHQLVKIWEEALKISPIGVTDNFFELGGHSLLAILVITEIEKQLGYTLPINSFFQEETIENIALHIENHRESANSDVLLPLQTKGNQAPLFLVHPGGGYG